VPDRIDAHQHVWDLTVRPQPWTDAFPVLQRSFSLDDARVDQAAADVGGTVLVQCVDDVAETRELLELAAREPFVRGVVGWLDLDVASFADDLAALRAAPGGDRLRGLRHQLQVEPDKGWLERAGVRRSLAVLGDAGLAYDVVVSPEQLRQVVATARELPGLRFVLDHCGNPSMRDGDLGAWRGDVAALAALPNTAVKLSGLVTHGTWGAASADELRPVADHVLETFGPARTAFGSDWPVCRLSAPYQEVVALTEAVTAHLSPRERDLVWSGAATAWYGLTTTESDEGATGRSSPRRRAAPRP
jgi:L-fuconolactonase